MSNVYADGFKSVANAVYFFLNPNRSSLRDSLELKKANLKLKTKSKGSIYRHHSCPLRSAHYQK